MMRKAICVLAARLGLAGRPTCQTAKEENDKRVARAKRLRCRSSDRFLWPGEPQPRNVVHPKPVILDMDQDCLYDMTALYDKFISSERVKQAIEGGLGSQAVGVLANSPIELCRVEAEK